MSKSHNHRISQGECLASVASNAGMLRDHIWDDAANKHLRSHRDPFLLCPGDHLTIPAPDMREESRTTENRHRFRRIDEPTKLLIRLLENDEPRTGIAWKLIDFGKVVAEGTTTDQGEVEAEIDSQLMKLTLEIGPAEKHERYSLLLGSLNPIETVSGVQARLTNLGIDPGPVDGILGPLTKGAIRVFQSEQDLDMNGRINNATRDALCVAYGC